MELKTIGIFGIWMQFRFMNLLFIELNYFDLIKHNVNQLIWYHMCQICYNLEENMSTSNIRAHPWKYWIILKTID